MRAQSLYHDDTEASKLTASRAFDIAVDMYSETCSSEIESDCSTVSCFVFT